MSKKGPHHARTGLAATADRPGILSAMFPSYDVLEKFGPATRARRRALELTQGQAAEEAGLSVRTWQRVEAAATRSRPATATAVASALKVPIPLLAPGYGLWGPGARAEYEAASFQADGTRLRYSRERGCWTLALNVR